MYNKITYNTLYSETQKEGSRKRSQMDTIVEGIGLKRLTQNFEMGLPLIDSAYRVSDFEAVEMSRYLVQDGFFVGSSSSVNCVAAVKLARDLGPGHTIVTLLCDHGSRHLTKFWNDQFVIDYCGFVPGLSVGLDFIQ